MVLDGVEILLCPRSQEEKQEWLECLRAAGYVSEQALTIWNGTERNASLFHGTERTVQCTAQLYSAMHSQILGQQ